MKNISDLKVEGPVTVHLHSGQVVVNGSDEAEVGRLIGHARVERHNGELVIQAEGALVLTLPSQSELTLRGTLNDAVLKDLRAVTIESCYGNVHANSLRSLRVEGAVHGQVSLKDVDGDVELDEVMGSLAAKRVGNLQARRVYGSASLKGVGALRLDSVMGSLGVREAKAVHVGHVHGDASVKQGGDVRLDEVSGDLAVSASETLAVKHVQGDAEISEVAGAISLDSVGGDLSVRSPGPSLTAARVGGDASLRGAPASGGEYQLRAAGDVELRLEGNVHLSLRADGDIELGEGNESERAEDGTLHVYLGQREGAAHVMVEAGGDILVNEGGRRERRHHRHRHHHHRHGPWEWSAEHEVEVNVDEEIRQAMDEVRSELKRASHTVRSELKRALRDVDTTASGPMGEVVRTTMRDLLSALRPAAPPPPPPPPPAERPVSPPAPTLAREELQAILSMVQAGTISPEEAERLIEALD